MSTADEFRAAAERRAAALTESNTGHLRYREAPRGVASARSLPFAAPTMTATLVERNGKDYYHLVGHATVFGVRYEMWDDFGPYWETVDSGTLDESLSHKPDTIYLANHRGLSMARTINGTLTLEKRDKGLYTEAFTNPTRTDVQDLVSAIVDGLVTEMSFGFELQDGQWSPDFTEFVITRADIHRGDVSAVNYGANPYTDVAARAREVMADIDRLPVGAARAAVARIQRRIGPAGVSGTADARSAGGGSVGRLRWVPVSGERAPRLAWRVNALAARALAVAQATGRPVDAVLADRLPWFRMQAPDETGPGSDTATIDIFDEIGGSMGVNAKEFVAQLDEITAPHITLRINSPGGSVFDAITMHSALLEHPAIVQTRVYGLAASAASVVAMAADRYDPGAETGGVLMMPGSQMMIHDASAMVDGNSAEVAKFQTWLDRQSENVAKLYARRGGGDPQHWRDMMLAETWMFDSEAVDLGLADLVVEADGPVTPPEDMERSWDMHGRYRYACRERAPQPGRRVSAVQRRAERSNTVDRSSGGRSIAVTEAMLMAFTKDD